MPRVVVPVRYPLSDRSERTLEEAIRVASERDASLTILHVDLYQTSGTVTRTDLRSVVRRTFDRRPRARYVVRKGFLVEETILEEVTSEEADVVVIGGKRVGRLKRLLGRAVDSPEIEQFLEDNLDCEVVVVE